MSFAVRYSKQARAAAREHVSWWSTNRSAEEAVTWIAAVERAVTSIASDPSRLPEAAESGIGGRRLREALIRPGKRVTHRILFEFDGTTVFLIHFKHVKQDGPSQDELTFGE